MPRRGEYAFAPGSSGGREAASLRRRYQVVATAGEGKRQAQFAASQALLSKVLAIGKDSNSRRTAHSASKKLQETRQKPRESDSRARQKKKKNRTQYLKLKVGETGV
jgi:hypothetical protein